MRALVVEDDLVCRRVLAKLLTVHGADVVAVATGGEALTAVHSAQAEGRPFQVVCLDIDMPDMTGHQVLSTLRREEDDRAMSPEERLRVVMTSGHSQPENVVLSFHNRCDGFLVKPVNPQKLTDKLTAMGFPPKPVPPAAPGT
jgi:two-component system chemotaxis response regulator CheY